MVKINNNIRGIKLNYGSDVKLKRTDNLKVKHRQTNKGYSYILDDKNHVEYILLDSEPYRVYNYIILDPVTGEARFRGGLNLTIREFEDKLKKGLIDIYGGSVPSRFVKNPSRKLMAEYRGHKGSQQVDWYLIPRMEYNAKKYGWK